MSYKMTKDEILKAVELSNEGMPYERIAAAMGRGFTAIRRHIRNYYLYGDSYFTDYPKRRDGV